MKKNKIKTLSIIFLGLAVLTMISWTITLVLEIDLFSIVTNSAFLTILFIPFVIVIYVAGAVVAIITNPAQILNILNFILTFSFTLIVNLIIFKTIIAIPKYVDTPITPTAPAT